MIMRTIMATSPSTKRSSALTLFEESVLKPDSKLRNCARNQECYDELMQVREEVLEYIKTLR